MKRKKSYEFGDCLSGDDQGDETSFDDDNTTGDNYYALNTEITSVQQNCSHGYNCGSSDHAGHRNCCDFTNCEFEEE